MDQKLTPQSFTNIFKDSISGILENLPTKAFSYCINSLNLPYLNEDEIKCIRNFSKVYLSSVDTGLIYFSKKTL